jgi:uncharacterized protein YneF (UPF0154 family)
MLTDFKNFVKKFKLEILWFLIILLSFLAGFAFGYLVSYFDSREPIKIEKENLYENQNFK